MIDINTPYITPDQKVLKVVYDEYPESPREWDNLSTFVTEERDYISPDENPEYSFEDLLEEVCTSKYIWSYVAKYEHSSVRYFRTTATHLNEWDTYVCGIMYVSKEDVRKEYGVKRISKKLLDKIFGIFDGELEEYTNYANGEVYAYHLYEMNGEEVDSCFGFYGGDNDVLDYLGYRESDLKEAIEITKTVFEKKE